MLELSQESGYSREEKGKATGEVSIPQWGIPMGWHNGPHFGLGGDYTEFFG